MHKIDSFVRETQRLGGLGTSSLDSFPTVPITNYWCTRLTFTQLSWSVAYYAHSHFQMASLFLRVHTLLSQRQPGIQMKESTRMPTNLMDFGLRSSRQVKGMLWEVDTKLSLHLWTTCPLDWDDTHGEHSWLLSAVPCVTFIIRYQSRTFLCCQWIEGVACASSGDVWYEVWGRERSSARFTHCNDVYPEDHRCDVQDTAEVRSPYFCQPCRQVSSILKICALVDYNLSLRLFDVAVYAMSLFEAYEEWRIF